MLTIQNNNIVLRNNGQLKKGRCYHKHIIQEKHRIQTKKHPRKLKFLRQFLCISQPKAITPLHVYDVPRTGLAQTH